MAGVRALQVALDWMSEGLPQASSDDCRAFRDATQASRSHNTLLYRVRLNSAGLRLERTSRAHLKDQLQLERDVWNAEFRDIRWILEELRTAPDERRQRFLDLVAQNIDLDEPFTWVDVWYWSEYPYEEPATY